MALASLGSKGKAWSIYSKGLNGRSFKSTGGFDNAFVSIKDASGKCEAIYLKENDYIFADSDRRMLNKSEIEILPLSFLQFARNEIYARHGYIFNSKNLKRYFTSKKWYNPVSKAVKLSNIEKNNAELIKAVEKIRNSYVGSCVREK